MQPIVIDGVEWSVCVSVCWSLLRALQKRLNESRCRLREEGEVDSNGPKIPCIIWGQDLSTGRVNFYGLSGPLKNFSQYHIVLYTMEIVSWPYITMTSLQP